jgi:hypothetical protein
MRSGLLATLLLTSVVFSQPTDLFSGRWKAPSTVVAMQGPYTWMDTVNTQTANYSVPSGYLVCEMRVTDSCLIRVKLRSRDSMTIRACAGDIFRLDLLKIYKTGTDSTAGCLNKIRLFGIKE